MKVFLIIGAVVVLIVGVLFTLRSTRNAGTPSAEVIERAKERSRQAAPDEKDD